MSNYSAGKDVLSYCNKCKLVLSHTIIAMKDLNTIGKVVCNTCKSTHTFKDPSTATAKKVSKKTMASTRETKSEKSMNHWQDLCDHSPSNSQPYSIKTKFIVGDKIDHPKFGLGFVESLLEGDKVNILFKTGEKTLVHNKK